MRCRKPNRPCLDRDLPANDERADYLRATLAAGTATPLPLQDSSMMQALAKADCLVIREPFDPARRAGERVPHP